MKSLPLQVRLLPIFKNLEDEVFASVSRGAIYKNYVKGDVVCNKGDPSNGLFVLIRGELQLYESGREGQEVGLNMIKGPAVFGDQTRAGQPRSSPPHVSFRQSFADRRRQKGLKAKPWLTSKRFPRTPPWLKKP